MLEGRRLILLLLSVQALLAQDIRFPDENDDNPELHVSGSKPASTTTAPTRMANSSFRASTTTLPTNTATNSRSPDAINKKTNLDSRSAFDLTPDDFGTQMMTGFDRGLDVTERKPLKSPSQCKENMLLYPDDGIKSAWVCDCVEGFVYYPLDDNCYKPYSRGPCLEHEYVYLKLNESVPICVHNPCNKTGEVPYKNQGCSKLNSRGGACESDEALLVNVTTYQLQCVNQFIVPQIIIDAPQRACPRGSRRNSQGQCKDVL